MHVHTATHICPHTPIAPPGAGVFSRVTAWGAETHMLLGIHALAGTQWYCDLEQIAIASLFLLLEQGHLTGTLSGFKEIMWKCTVT